MMNVRNARKVDMKVKSGYVALYVINGTSNLSNLSHNVLLLNYTNRLHVIYMVKIPCIS